MQVGLVFARQDDPGEVRAPGGEDFLFHAADGENERAANSFRKAIEIEPEDSYLRLEHAEFLSRRGLLRQAIREAELALDLDEGNLEAVRLVGYLHLELAPGDSRSIRLARSAFERMYDMILSHGKRDYVDNKKKIVHYDFFDDSENRGADAAA